MSASLTLEQLASDILLPAVAALFGLAILAALVEGRRRIPARTSLGLSALASVGVLGLGVAVLLSGRPVTATAGSVLGFPIIDVRFDALSAVFLIALGLAGAAASVYAIGYERHGAGDRIAIAFPVFLISLALVFGASDAFAFLFAWELMALSSAALVVGSRPNRDVARAGYIYLATTHLATAAIVIAFAIPAAAAGTSDFAAFGAAAAGLAPSLRDITFVLILVGFATKAGAIPFHVWLPRAHPVAPSYVSALMSGVMIKAGVYGLVRFGLEMLGPGPEWWGLLILGIGVVSAVLGILYALMEHDLKRLLAFSSIENIGIILIGLGIALIAAGAGSVAIAGIALTAALFHALNHAIFKSTLFLAAGSVQTGAGSRDLNRLGGLVRLMPVTTLAFAIGAAAISGLPPLNGFASEWLTFQSLVAAGGDPAMSAIARSAALLAVGALGLTAALAVACFVKATGIGFLALPRGAGAAAARESTRWMRAPMVALAAICVVLGVAAGPVTAVIASVADAVIVHGSAAVATPITSAHVATRLDPVIGGAVYAAAGVAALLVIITGVIWLTVLRPRPARRVPTWSGGILPEPAFEYTATSYAKLIRLYFGPVLRPVREVAVELHPGTPFPRVVRYRGRAKHVIDERLYGPLHRAAVDGAQLARRLQNGSLQLYLAYSVVALVILLVLAR